MSSSFLPRFVAFRALYSSRPSSIELTRPFSSSTARDHSPHLPQQTPEGTVQGPHAQERRYDPGTLSRGDVEDQDREGEEDSAGIVEQPDDAVEEVSLDLSGFLPPPTHSHR